MSDTKFEENNKENNEDIMEEEEEEEDYYDDDQNNNHEEFLLINDPTKYAYIRRVVQRPYTKKNEIYLSNNGKFIYYVKRAKKLLTIEKEKEIIIHGLGAAIPLAIKLSLYLQKEFQNNIILSPTTSTEEIIDQYDPLVDDLEPVLKIRHASAIHIKIILNDDNNNNSNNGKVSTLTPIIFKKAVRREQTEERKERKNQLKKQEQEYLEKIKKQRSEIQQQRQELIKQQQQQQQQME